ncbi:S-layer homology domain-containing protein [Clostridium aminobutyricum]|uniref:S-layer homology domain-containing protein n=1 Tax=Clostridium aminobutyricum TaxID=33953 RepID=A0A939IHN8_CLOAM|nr:S-layer homology domain-containing protein [Clostridium aminobutyricum]MBN7774027.1 S-layer homology domain-containing protein [Clostridium aminobutyricum]
MITELRLKRMARVISGKLLIASVVGAIILGTFGYAVADTADTVTFKDVPKDYWGYDYIHFSAEKSIIKGYQQYDGTYLFEPENAVTYEEAATMLYRAINAAGDLQSTDDFQSEFESVLTENKIAEWARPTVAYCLKFGIIDTSELAVFTDDQGNGQKAPRLQTALWTAKAMGMKLTSAYSVPYSDAAVISEEDRPYIDMLYRHGIMKGSLQTDGTTAFLPAEGIKRSEFAAISNRVYESVASEKAAGTSGYYDAAKETVSIRGKVTAVEESKELIQLTDAATGLARNIYVDSSAALVYNGEPVTKGLSGIKADITGKTVIVSSLTGTDGTEIKQVNIDTQPFSCSGTIKSIKTVSATVKMIGIAIGEDKTQPVIYYIMDAKTTSKATVKEGAAITFIADGINLIEMT